MGSSSTSPIFWSTRSYTSIGRSIKLSWSRLRLVCRFCSALSWECAESVLLVEIVSISTQICLMSCELEAPKTIFRLHLTVLMSSCNARSLDWFFCHTCVRKTDFSDVFANPMRVSTSVFSFSNLSPAWSSKWRICASCPSSVGAPVRLSRAKPTWCNISSMSKTSLPKACSLPGKGLHNSRSSSNARAVEAATAAMLVMLSMIDKLVHVEVNRSLKTW